MNRPQRHRKDDRLLQHGATKAEIECDMATGPFDQKAREMDRKYGCDRLPDLVSPETAARWGTAMANLNAALTAGDVAVTVARVNACLRGFAAMDAEATAAGHKPIAPEAWQITVDGKAGVILRDAAAWPAFNAAHPGVTIWTLQEVENALAHYGGMVVAVKDAFPGATVTAIRPRTKLEKEIGDEIPW